MCFRPEWPIFRHIQCHIAALGVSIVIIVRSSEEGQAGRQRTNLITDQVDTNASMGSRMHLTQLPA